MWYCGRYISILVGSNLSSLPVGVWRWKRLSTADCRLGSVVRFVVVLPWSPMHTRCLSLDDLKKIWKLEIIYFKLTHLILIFNFPNLLKYLWLSSMKETFFMHSFQSQNLLWNLKICINHIILLETALIKEIYLSSGVTSRSLWLIGL